MFAQHCLFFVMSHHHPSQKLSVLNTVLYRAISLSQPDNLQEARVSHRFQYGLQK